MNKCPEAGVFRSKKSVAANASEILAGFCVLIAFILGCFAGSSCTNKWSVATLKSEAVQKGYAEWQIIDNQSGATKFTWKQ
jgi:hypothetical protein